jgi:hypothetical protein
MYRKFLLIIFISCSFYFTALSQELQANVTVISSRIPTTVDKKIFTTLQTQLNNFLNNRKWTTDTYKTNEKIVCNFY